MRYLSHQIVFREIPNEISLSYLVTGCPLRCLGCHSADAWNATVGDELSKSKFFEHLEKYANWITCVLFLGGEWESEYLLSLLKIAHDVGLKTALYTGLDQIDINILSNLDYIKTGPYVRHLGGLSSSKTNQKLINLRTGEVLNHYFLNNKEDNNGSFNGATAQ